MKKLTFLLSLLLVTALVAVNYSCNKEDDEPEPDTKELLLDKTWYSVGEIGNGTQFYGSDGTYTFQPAGVTGTWVWGPNDSMYMVSAGGANFTFWFMKIEDDYMEYWPTFEPEGNIYKFSTVKP